MPILRNIPRHAVVAAAALVLGGPVAAHAHDSVRAAETALVGADHASEHAALRELQRSPAARRQLARAERTARRMARVAAAEPLDEVGRWGSSFDIPVFAINAALLPTGKILWFAYPNSPDYGPGIRHGGIAYLWDPAKGAGADAFTAVPPPIDPARGLPVNLFCAGISFLADGQVLVTGGNLQYPAETAGRKYAGLDHVYTFDPWSERWTRQPDMNHGRWYPSQLLLPDGRTFIMGGLDEGGFAVKNEDLELFTPAAQRGGVGSVSLLGPEGVLGDPGRPPVGDYYPHLFWMPSGRALVAGPYTSDSWWLDRPGDPSDISWTDIGNFPSSRVWGSAVLVPDGPAGSREVMQIGGSDKPAADAAQVDALATASTIAFDEREGSWMAAKPLNVARSHLNTVLLPDSSMVTIGGGLGAVRGQPGQYAVNADQLRTELWNPRTGVWRLGPAQREFRTYHSTAVLLPDARVVSAGDDYHGRFGDARDFVQDSAEIYEPPYLFDGDRRARRPAIRRAPSAITWRASFDIGVRARRKRKVTRAVLVAPGATTHAVDINQRVVPLRTKAQDGTIRARAPRSRDVAPPGVYMLFVLDRTGTPSKARWVRLETLPNVSARIVRRGQRRQLRLRVGRSDVRRLRVRVRLLDRRHRTRGARLVTVRTGRTTIVRSVRISPRIRSVAATAWRLQR